MTQTASAGEPARNAAPGPGTRVLPLMARCALALVFGMALTMSFAPARAWWFAPYCVAGFLYLLDARWRGALAIGSCFGLGWFGAGFWWIMPALDSYSDGGALFSVQMTVALVVYMSLFPACAAVLIARCRRAARSTWRERLWAALRIALIFAVAEWARGNLFGGFPMLATGYAHTGGPLAGFAPLVGVHGMCFVNAFVAALLTDAFAPVPQCANRLRWVGSAALLALVLSTGAMLKRVEWATGGERTLSISMLQGNIAQGVKFSDAGFVRAATTYLDMAAMTQGQLIVLPETALPFEWSSMPPGVAAAFQQVANHRDATIVVGAIVHRAAVHGGREGLTNSAVALAPQTARAASWYRYDKQHLVPFAESLPWGAGWIGRRLGTLSSGLLPGAAQQAPLVVDGERIAMTICFESLFDTAVAGKASDAGMILNLTNFAWSAGSYAPDQHLQVAQMRAMETARWVAQASNTGMTALIGPDGTIRQQLPPDLTGVLEGEVRLLSGKTPFMVLGNSPLLIGAALACLWPVLRRTFRPAGTIMGAREA